MANHLSVATVIEKNRIHSTVAFVPLLDIYIKDETGVVAETIRVANNTENVTFGGNTYTAAAFEFTIRSESGEAPDFQVNVKDFSRAIEAAMQEHGGGVGAEVTVTVVNTGALSAPVEIQETFKVISASSKNYIASFRLGAENPLSMRFPRRMQFKDRCQWVYKGAQCAYAGPLATCDYSLLGENGCAAHDNTPRFGGFPGINLIRT